MKYVSTYILFLICLTANAQNILIPDSIFKARLVNDTSINTNNDSEIQLSEALAVETLLVSFLGIQNLAGIEAFTNLASLDCSRNPISSLDLSSNVNLMRLVCNSTDIDSISLEFNPLMNHLVIGGNFLAHLNLSANTNLDYFQLYPSTMDSIDFSTNPNLTTILLNGSSIQWTNLASNISLDRLVVSNTSIDSINLDNNTNLSFVNIRHNDVLHYLSIQNGNNGLLSTFNSQNNDNLLCIKIDGAVLPDMHADPWTGFDQNCGGYACNSYSYHELPLLCTYGGDSTLPHSRIDTLVNSLGCDSFFIIKYDNLITDTDYKYDSIVIVDSMNLLFPVLHYRYSAWGGPYIMESERFATQSFNFQWYRNGVEIQGANDSTYYPLETGLYEVELDLFWFNGICKVFSLPYFINIPTSLLETRTNSIAVYPNPVQASFFVSSKEYSRGIIEVYNLLGKKCVNRVIDFNQTVILDELKTGVYMMIIKDVRGIQIHQHSFIKE